MYRYKLGNDSVKRVLLVSRQAVIKKEAVEDLYRIYGKVEIMEYKLDNVTFRKEGIIEKGKNCDVFAFFEIPKVFVMQLLEYLKDKEKIISCPFDEYDFQGRFWARVLGMCSDSILDTRFKLEFL